MSYDTEQLRRIIEGAILASGETLSLDRLLALFEEHEAPEKSEIKQVLELIAADCAGRGFQLVEVASGWRFQVREDVATWVNRLWEEKPQKYSRALLETLALIAYRQPITRGDIEDVRGVAVSSQIIKTLVEREWVKVVGQRDVPGRPSLYATTRQFLDYFNLKSLDELPTLSELKDIDSLNGSLDLSSAGSGDTAGKSQSTEDSTPAQADSEAASDGSGTGTENESESEESEAGTPREVAEHLRDSEVQERMLSDGSNVFDPDEQRDIESVSGDTLAVNEQEDEPIPVEAANMPFELDEEASRPKNTDIPDATPTIEQEEYEERLDRDAEEDHDSQADSDDEPPSENEDR